MHGGTLKIVECVLGVFSAPVLSRTPYFKESKLGGGWGVTGEEYIVKLI